MPRGYKALEGFHIFPDMLRNPVFVRCVYAVIVNGAFCIHFFMTEIVANPDDRVGKLNRDSFGFSMFTLGTGNVFPTMSQRHVMYFRILAAMINLVQLPTVPKLLQRLRQFG